MNLEYKKVFVLALDGVPYSFLEKMIQKNVMPNFGKLAQNGFFTRMNSVQPPVSSVAWASFLTGQTPNKHGILSFTERNPATLDLYTPDARHLKEKTIVQRLSDLGKRTFIMNVPATYPPQKINGISVCGFLGNDVVKGTYPPEEGRFLHNNGYRIDADTQLAKTDFPAFLQDLKTVLEKRIEMMWHYFAQEEWDFFMTHLMESDRLHHFTWEFQASGHPHFVELYKRFYKRLDDLIGEVLNRLDNKTAFMLLSDHGFTTLKKEVYLNTWLWQNDYLRFTTPYPQNLHDMHPQSRAYALYPGRIFINLKGREKNGAVSTGIAFDALRKELEEKLLDLKDPASGDAIVNEVLYAEHIYPKGSEADDRADLLAIAHEGYDLKGKMWNKELFQKTIFNGMHTFDDAFFLSSADGLEVENPAITDLAGFIMRIFE